MAKKIKIGSRESKLAMIQSQFVADSIKKFCPEYDIEIVKIKTTGDKILNKTLDKIGGKGLFVKEIDKALICGDIDIAVHSLKDVPAVIDKNLIIGAYTKRVWPYDVLVLPKSASEIDFSKPIGSASLRRCIQFKNLYPLAEFKPIRGNVLTRLKKLDSGEYAALILAQAGLERLCLESRINKIFSSNEIIPAAGQGIIAVQIRKDSNFDFIKYINDVNSEICAKAERAFIKKLDGGCSSPVAAFADICNDKITITGFYSDNYISKTLTISGNIEDSEKIGANLAEKIKGVVL